MKSFGEVKIGDKIYTIDEDYRIRELYVCGIEDVNLAHKEISIKILNSITFTVRMNETKTIAHSGRTLYSCLESAQFEKGKIKHIYAEKQFRLAMQAFRRIKKVIPNIEEQKKRVLGFFQILENKEE